MSTLQPESSFETKHLIFVEYKDTNKRTKKFRIISKHDDSILGKIQWINTWREYGFYPTIEYETQFSYECMNEITEFIKMLMINHKIEWR